MWVLFLFVLGCTGTVKRTQEEAKVYFPGSKGCFLLYNLKTHFFEKEIGAENCREQLVACSTFKVPLAVMAFDAGLLRDENQVLKWDGKKGFLESHDRDHNAKTWIRDSVVWFSQRLTPKLGLKKTIQYLKDFHYGNADLRGGLTEAWLVSPGKTNDPALKVSAYEQVEFMKSLWTDALPVSKDAMKRVREITFLEKSPRGFLLSGKTGSNFFDENHGQDQRRGLGWFVSHLERGSQEYIVVTRFTDEELKPANQYGGPRAKQITKDILADLGLW